MTLTPAERLRRCALDYMLRDPPRTERLWKLADELAEMERAEVEQSEPSSNVVNLSSRRRMPPRLRVIGEAS